MTGKRWTFGWRRRLAVFGMVALLMPAAVFAEVMVIADRSNPHHREFVAALDPGSEEGAVVYDVNDPLPLERDWEAVIAVGGRAGARVAARRPGLRRLYALIPEAAARDWLRDDTDAGLFLDTDPHLIAQLLREVLPDATSVRVLVGPNTGAYGERMADAARTLGLTPHILPINTRPGDTELDSRELNAIFVNGDAVVVATDPAVLNRGTVVPLIREAYLRERPLIAHSRSVVRAGALMALHSTPAKLGREASEWLQGGERPRAPYAADYEVAVNYGVARALGLELPGQAELQRRLEERVAP